MNDGRPQDTGRWARLKVPTRVGLICALLGVILAIVGIARGVVPLRPLSILLALLISGGTWGIVSWAIATAAADVDQEVLAADSEGEEADSD